MASKAFGAKLGKPPGSASIFPIKIRTLHCYIYFEYPLLNILLACASPPKTRSRQLLWPPQTTAQPQPPTLMNLPARALTVDNLPPPKPQAPSNTCPAPNTSTPPCVSSPRDYPTPRPAMRQLRDSLRADAAEPHGRVSLVCTILATLGTLRRCTCTVPVGMGPSRCSSCGTR